MSTRTRTRTALAAAAATATFALVGALGVTAAHARGADVQWSVTIGSPVLTLPAPVLTLPVPAPVVVAPRPTVVVLPPVRPVVHDRYYGYGGYREPTRWDVDGDGIPNRYDRVYNPAWDRNGDGIADRYQWRQRHHPHHPYADRDRDGIPNRYDRRDDRYDRYDPRWSEPHSRGEGRGPR